jgi:nitrate/TMAO reductase-like tetraheme cytochrome c subunit
MRKLLERLKLFFLPPHGTPTWLRILPYAILGLLTVSVLIGGSYAWEYTNSSEFCGTSCHTMPPEYNAYLVSPHARVQCVECHIGRDVFTTTFTRKAGDIRHIVLNITKAYEFPLHAVNMRPASDSCETCHFPEKFSDDSLRDIRNYLPDEDNTRQDIYLVMKTGGGTKREGLGYGIHWHIENPVLYYATDEYDQNIPYVRVIDEDGNATEYIDISAGIDPADIDESGLVQMDCITCHNRITHKVSKPEEAVSQAIRKGLMVSDLPYLVEQSIALLRGDYPDKTSGIEAMERLNTYYQENYPAIYADRSADIQQAVTILQDIYNQSVFPEQKSDWDTHANNLGHKTDPGCFRCHDGKHLTEENQAIRLECNICHSIPVVADPTSLTTDIELVSGPEPDSHTSTHWIALHGKAKDNSCKACHTTPEGIDNLASLQNKPSPGSSFCGNLACHGNVWTYAGFDAPALQGILETELESLQESAPSVPTNKPLTYEDFFGAVFQDRCSTCHSGDDPMAGMDVTTYAGLLEGGIDGPGIVPGDLDASLIYLKQSDPKGHYGQLTEDELDALREWILAGVPEN